jgi:hypothetical protein
MILLGLEESHKLVLEGQEKATAISFLLKIYYLEVITRPTDTSVFNSFIFPKHLYFSKLL